MLECKRCGATQIVKSGEIRRNGEIRGKQRYLCKQCGCHFVEGDQRKKGLSASMKAACRALQALNFKEYKLLATYLDRDISLIYRWMQEGTPGDRVSGDTRVLEFSTVRSLLEAMERDGLANSDLMLVENRTEDLYFAVILQGRKRR